MSAVPAFRHVYLIVFENREYEEIVGSASAPFINSLIPTSGLATSFFAETHPSQPNYIALTSGGTQGVGDDGNHDLAVDNLFAQMAASGRSWRAWEQAYPGGCFTGGSSGSIADGPGVAAPYVRKHNPAISYTTISRDPAACANITNLAAFDPSAADFNFITPNTVNDMHDGSIAAGDDFLRAFLPEITSSAAFADSVVFITWDEGTTGAHGGGHILTLAVSPRLRSGSVIGATFDHYALLRTIEDAWGLPRLGAAASAPDLAFPW